VKQKEVNIFVMRRRKKTRVEQAHETRERLLRIARRLFAQNGYHATGTHEIVKQAKITRGALCHYFPRKEDLFLAVFQEVRGEWISDATKETHGTDNRWERLREHIKLFIRTATSPDVHRIVLIDGPAVLGWKAWREIQARDGLSVITDAIQDGIAAKAIRPQPPEALAYLLIALIEESALLVTYADNPREAVVRAELALDTLLSNMR
jgi:AcrR family transcriptional regulator